MPRSTTDGASGEAATILNANEEPVLAYIGLGANLGDAAATVLAALDAVERLAWTEALLRSPLYRSAPIGGAGPDYVNAVMAVTTRLRAQVMLAQLQAIEHAHGRERPYRNAPRSLDLDLLLYGGCVIDTPGLTLPHPRMHERRFVLQPLSDIAPSLTIPGHGPVLRLLAGVAAQRLTRIDPC
jgi:2-amino-4-hydroxy-6-hydroxymethyldihydropteridine diphosphokinase